MVTPRPPEFAYLLSHFGHLFNKRLRDVLFRHGLTVSQYDILSAFRAGESLSNAQLADRLVITPQSATTMVRALEARGWLKRSAHPKHGRIVEIRLTSSGDAILRRCDTRPRPGHAAILNRLNATALGSVKLIKKLAEASLFKPQEYSFQQETSLHSIING